MGTLSIVVLGLICFIFGFGFALRGFHLDMKKWLEKGYIIINGDAYTLTKKEIEK